jgi:hypothetical protein
MVCLGNICINTLHKGAKADDDDDDDENSNNNNKNNNKKENSNGRHALPGIHSINIVR